MNKSKITEEQSISAQKMIQEGSKYKEISSALNVTLASIKQHLNKKGHYSLNLKIKMIKCLDCGQEKPHREVVNGKKIIRTKFCNVACSLNHTAKNRKKKERKKCLNCQEPCKTRKSIYCCSSCQFELQEKIIIDKVKNNDTKGLSAITIKKALIKIHGEKCMKCGWNKIHPTTKKVPIELNHKDGNSENNETKNVELICPNCHSLTPNYRGLNRGNGRYKRKQRARDGKSF